MAADTHAPTRTLTLASLELFGEALGRALRTPALVTLRGDLGAGKTTLTQAICRGLGVTEPVTSPTFALVHEYHARQARVVHCDLYRLETPRDVAALGLDDLLADPEVIMLVEWPDRAGALLGTPTLSLTLQHVAGDANVRSVTEVWHS